MATAPGLAGHDAFSRLGAAARDIGARLIVIDDLGLAGDPGQDLSPDSAAARAASLATALDIPVIATTHLDPYPGDVPRPADLCYPRILEHADHLALLNRPALHSPAAGRPDLVTCHVTGRAGPELGRVTLHFEPEFHRMTARG
ncbi:hypothetical protein AB0N09_28205 [Streptomyces erythrochromogenes]|uniref:hypothetical protein n=1 Tax=Streptomyces erythrochromogenes TaxID=285574 RepID=UPI003425227D